MPACGMWFGSGRLMSKPCRENIFRCTADYFFVDNVLSTRLMLRWNSKGWWEIKQVTVVQ